MGGPVGPLDAAARLRAPRSRQDSLSRLSRAIRWRRWDQVETLCVRLLKTSPTSIEAHYARAIAAFQRHDFAAARQHAAAGLAAEPASGDCAELLAIVYAVAGLPSEAALHAELASRATSSARLRSLLPADFPPLTRVLRVNATKPFLKRGQRAMVDADWRTAEHWLRQHLAFEPSCRPGLLALAVTLIADGRDRDAASVLRTARHHHPHDPEIASTLARVLATLGKLAEATVCHRIARVLDPTDPALAASALIDSLREPEPDADQLAAGFAAWGRQFGLSRAVPSTHPRLAEPASRSTPLRLGLVLADRGATRLGGALAELLTHRDRRRMATIGFGFGSLADSANRVFEGGIDQWEDVSSADPAAFAVAVQRQAVDILLDTAGFGNPAHLAAFATRMAACQVLWLDAPYGSGLAAADFLLTDRFQDTKPRPSYGELPLYLDLGASLVDWSLARMPMTDRAIDNTLTFGADATLAEITPAAAALWARILLEHPGSRLLLRDHDFHNRDNVARLVELFGSFGVAAQVDIEIAGLRDFFAAIDVCLLPYGAAPSPQTVADALACGVPVIVPAQRARHTRAAGSLVHHLGLAQDMLATSQDAYMRHARHWADGRLARQAWHAKSRMILAGCAAVSPLARMSDLARALEAAWRQCREEGAARLASRAMAS